jgi:hypothetical protein
LEYFTDIWDILKPFGNFCVHLIHFCGFGIMHQEKSGNPARYFASKPVLLYELCRIILLIRHVTILFPPDDTFPLSLLRNPP